MSVFLALPSLRRGHERSPCNKKDAPAKLRGLGENIYKLEKCGQGHVPTSKLSEEEELVIDSGASVQMLSKRDLNSKEINNLQIEKPFRGDDGKWESANKRGSTSVC